MSIRQRWTERTQRVLNSPTQRWGALIAAGVIGYLAYTLSGQELKQRAEAPLPIIQGQQLRFPANHPQLALLSTAPAMAAEKIVIELPARLVWNEERTQRIYPAFAGRVSRLLADVGQTVHPGQVLATLASPDFGAAQADAVKAQADAELNERAYRRQQQLFEADVISRKDLELAEASALRARAEQARAQAVTRLYGSHLQVNQELGLAASMSGVMVERNLSPGLEVRPDQNGAGGPALIVVSDPTSLWLQIDAHEADVAWLKKGTPIGLTLPNFPGQTFTAKIAASGDFIDSNSRTIKVRAVIDNPQRQLKAEMLGTALIHRPLTGGVLVPANAVQLRGREHWVFVQTAPGVFEPRQVQLGYQGQKEVEVREGLAAGEQVVKENALLLAREFRNAEEEAQLQGRPSTRSSDNPDKK